MKRPAISASYNETSALANSSKQRKSKSDVWNHFIKETDQNGMVWAKCKRCGQRSSGSSKYGTTHLKNHWNSSKCKRSQKETGGLENPTVTDGNFVFDEERSGLDLVRMIIKNGYPLNVVEQEDFKILMKNLQPAFKLPSQDTLKDKILCLYREEKEKLRKQFDKVLSFSLILNFWTDCGKKSKYCSFTLQFIEDGPKLMKKNIAIKSVGYNYTGETLFEIVKVVLLEWNIDKKLATITVESSSANDDLVNILQIWLRDQGNCHPLRKQIFHIPCITHVINLLVKDGLDQIDYIVPKIRKAIKYMRETTIGKQKFEEVVKKLNLGGKEITSEGVPVRWDSTFFTLQIALELRRQGEAFVDLQSTDCFFPMEEWDKAKVVHKCLTVFYDAICSFFGSKCLSTNVYFRNIFDIFKSLNQWQESDIAKKMKVNLDKYFRLVSFVSAIVAVFDPRTKLDFVEYSFKQHSGGISQHWEMLNVALCNTFRLYAEYLTSQRSSSSLINNDNSSSSDGDDPCNILDDWKKSKRQRTELEKYLQEPLQPDEEFDILGWWHTKSQDSPTLWTMARDILAIPMSTSTSNSAFCIETMTLDPIFNDLDPDIIEALFCGKDWLDNPIRITPNKDNDHSTANPEPTLEISGSTSGLEPLPTGDTLPVWSGTLALQEEYVPSIANTELANPSTSEHHELFPGSVSTSNSVFCIEPPTIDPIFNGLDPNIIEALVCGKEWLNDPIRITPNKDNKHSPELTQTSSVLEHAPSFANAAEVLANNSSTAHLEPFASFGPQPRLIRPPGPDGPISAALGLAGPRGPPEKIHRIVYFCKRRIQAFRRIRPPGQIQRVVPLLQLRWIRPPLLWISGGPGLPWTTYRVYLSNSVMDTKKPDYFSTTNAKKHTAMMEEKSKNLVVELVHCS